MRPFLVLVGVLTALAGPGCTRITVTPSCPEELDVGETVQLTANERSPGEIATYTWEVTPPSAGSFADPQSKDATFEALQPGEAVIRLTASDGLFVSIAECRVQIGDEVVAVALSADPSTGGTGTQFTLTCTSTGDPPATGLVIDQLDGAPVNLTETSEGMATFTAETTGDFVFRCTGTASDGSESDPAVLTISVSRSGGGRPPGR